MKILGHRGARHEAPENTLEGIAHALAAGADGVEVDLRRTRDGGLVVIHDADLLRTTGAAGAVRASDLERLRALDAGGGQRVPTLQEVLDALRGRGELHVEIKDADCAVQAARCIAAAAAADWCALLCFDHRPLAAARDAAPGLRTGCLLVGRPVDPVGVVRAAQADVLSVACDHADAELVAACHAAGIGVCAWNCNEPEAVAGFRERGLDWLCTDAPACIVPAARAAADAAPPAGGNRGGRVP